jgi:hypothetical protein
MDTKPDSTTREGRSEIERRPWWDSPSEPRDRDYGDELPPAIAKIRHVKKRAYLSAFAQTGNIRRSCEAAGIDRSTYYTWLEHDPDFGPAVEFAKQFAIERLEDEARRRAYYGTRKIRRSYSRDGDLVAEHIEYEYSDTLMIFLLKGLAPEKYAERRSIDLRMDSQVRERAEQIAREYGLDPDEVIERAEQWLAESGQE